MKVKAVIFLLLSVAVITFTSCASKRFTRQASKMEEAGLFSDAAELYYRALLRKKTNIDAITGLKRTGELTLGTKLSDFNRAYNEQRNKEAVYYYLDAKAYYNKIRTVNVELNFPSYYYDYYSEVKNIFLEDKYFEAMNYLHTESFSRAEQCFKEIIEIHPNYRDVKEQLNIAIYEPVYRDCLLLINNRKYKEAYFKLKRITNKIGAYKDVYDLKNECLEKGTVIIAIAPIKNSSSRKSIEKNIKNEIINSIQKLNNPFIKLIDRTKLQISDNIHSTITFTVSDAVLYCEITSFNYNAGRLHETIQRGYLKKRVRYKNTETEKYEYRTEYDKITYKEFKMSRTIDINISFRLINERTKEILNSGLRTFKVYDNIHYATYGVNTNDLVPGYWGSRTSKNKEDVIKDNRRDVEELQNLFKARKTIRTYDALASETYNNVSEYIAYEVNKYVIEN